MLSFWTQFVIFCLHPCFRLKLHLLEKKWHITTAWHIELTVKLDLEISAEKMSFLVIQMISHWQLISPSLEECHLGGAVKQDVCCWSPPLSQREIHGLISSFCYGFCSGRLIGIILLPQLVLPLIPHIHWISTGCYFLTLWRNQFLCSFSCILFTGSILKLLECKYFRNYYTLTSYFWEIES